jgi:hypothetical protein
MVAAGRKVYLFDFGTNVIPGEENPGYWRDIGTIESYFDATWTSWRSSPSSTSTTPVAAAHGDELRPAGEVRLQRPGHARVGIATDSW